MLSLLTAAAHLKRSGTSLEQLEISFLTLNAHLPLGPVGSPAELSEAPTASDSSGCRTKPFKLLLIALAATPSSFCVCPPAAFNRRFPCLLKANMFSETGCEYERCCNGAAALKQNEPAVSTSLNAFVCFWFFMQQLLKHFQAFGSSVHFSW